MIGGPPGLVRPRADDEAVTLVVAAVEARPARPVHAWRQISISSIGAPDALAAMTAEALELDVPVAESEADHAATAGQHVEEGPVLGHPDRIVQRRQGEAESDRDARRRLDHRRGVGGHRSDEPGLVEVVLAHPHAVEPDLLGEDDLVDRFAQRRAVVEPGSGVPLAREDAQTELHHDGRM